MAAVLRPPKIKAAEVERADLLRASYEATLDVLQLLVEAFPELDRTHSTDPQQGALRAARAHLAEAGRRIR